jgi:hypothetical protein
MWTMYGFLKLSGSSLFVCNAPVDMQNDCLIQKR